MFFSNLIQLQRNNSSSSGVERQQKPFKPQPLSKTLSVSYVSILIVFVFFTDCEAAGCWGNSRGEVTKSSGGSRRLLTAHVQAGWAKPGELKNGQKQAKRAAQTFSDQSPLCSNYGPNTGAELISACNSKYLLPPAPHGKGTGG